MRIPGGDLMPARRRRYGGGYGRRRRRNRRVIAVVLLLGVGGAAAWYLRQDDAAAPTRVSTLPACPSATPTPVATRPPATHVTLPQPGTISLTVLNGTNRPLLAKRVGDALAALGFHVTGQANNRMAVAGPSQVVYGPGASLAARAVTTWVPGSTVVPDPRARPGSVQLVLGSSFTRLSTPAEAAAAARGPAPIVTTAPTPSASVLPCRS